MTNSVSGSQRQSPWVTALRFVHDRNPFYPLSALCMFIGFRIIISALNSPAGDWKSLLGLICTLQLYEFALIALALFLIVRCGLQRDGWILLGIDALFLVDLTNLNAELFTAKPVLGSVINGVCFLLAMAKILLIVRTLGLRLTLGTTFYIAAQMAFLLGMPGIFRILRSTAGTVSPLQIYGIWWIAALLIAAGAFLVKRSHANDQSPMAALPWRLYVLTPLVSMLIHLASENRVYWVHFQLANVGPLFLALVVLLNLSGWCVHRISLRISMVLIVAAVMVSIVPTEYQHDLSGKFLGAAISPLRLVLLASTCLTIWLALQNNLLIVAAGAVSMLISGMLGASVSEIKQQLTIMAKWLWRSLEQLTPTTATQWGVLAIVAAFLLLGIGAMVSMKAAMHRRVAEVAPE